MNKYAWRNNVTATVSGIKGKLACKTQGTSWVNTDSPVIILVSVQSAFHSGINGEMKMQAMLSTIKENVQGKITILLADQAHIHTMGHDLARELASELRERHSMLFDGCFVQDWSHYICSDSHYSASLARVRDLYRHDPHFRAHLLADRANLDDLFEQCACILVLANKGYRFQFYPGRPNRSTEYINRHLLPPEKQINWIDLFVTIEKKIVDL